ncbi:hypothetical protein V7S43_010806 [Phytophthora oleae]|uniref:Sulfatase N-terminal domain-containing protein n=1 Tax=Phytophthora oleae TaxID=2107226 RepID=A0ABD3FAM8_9STRA
MAVVALGRASSPLVAYSALNATLNELFGHALQPAPTESTFTNADGNLPWMEMYIHPTERHKLYGNDSMYRLTTGFRGDLEFDVDISDDNPPNVLIIGVESFRYQDSRYFVGEEDPSRLFTGTDLVITPNFDRWAKRGISLQNLWTSVPTSRSLESVLFAQTPYDSPVKTGITGGRVGTNLSGLPHSSRLRDTKLSSGPGLPLISTTGTLFFLLTGLILFGITTRFSNWLKITITLPTISGKILGDLLVNKTRNETEQVSNGEPKTPLFITHYTITSHAPFDSVPTSYQKAKKPDFSALYAGEEHAKMIQRYLDVRYFTDMQLGKFLDRIDEEGVLNDTIVVIYGDHGQAPEAKIIYTEEGSMTRVPGLILAESD